MSTLTIYNRHSVDQMRLAAILSDELHAPCTAALNEHESATFTIGVSIERLVNAAEFWLMSMPSTGWGVTA